MALITSILCWIVTGDEARGGTDGDVYLGLGGREFHLDSGVGPEREDAHRLYFNTGLRITSYHFAAPLE